MTNKVTLADLAAKSSKLELTIPGHDEPCTFLMIKGGHTHEYRDAAQAIADDAGSLKGMKVVATKRAELFSTIIIDWDTEVFGEFSKDGVVALLANEEYEWIVNAVEVAITEIARFFNKPVEQSK